MDLVLPLLSKVPHLYEIVLLVGLVSSLCTTLRGFVYVFDRLPFKVKVGDSKFAHFLTVFGADVEKLRALLAKVPLAPVAMICFLTFGALQACSAAQPAPANTAEEAACKRAITDLKAYKIEGLSCEAAQKRVLAEEPLCLLDYSCPDAGDAGQE